LFNEWWSEIIQEDILGRMGAIAIALIFQIPMFIFALASGILGYVPLRVFFYMFLGFESDFDHDDSYEKDVNWYSWQHSLLGTAFSGAALIAYGHGYGWHVSIAFIVPYVLNIIYKYLIEKFDL
jgi:hypothetical protein